MERGPELDHGEAVQARGSCLVGGQQVSPSGVHEAEGQRRPVQSVTAIQSGDGVLRTTCRASHHLPALLLAWQDSSIMSALTYE